MADSLRVSKILSRVHEALSRYLNQKSRICDTFLAGGCMLPPKEGQRINDYDLFFRSGDSLASIMRDVLPDSLRFKVVEDDKIPGLKRGVLSSIDGELGIEIDRLNKRIKKKRIKLFGQSGLNLEVAFLSENAVSFSNGIQIIFRFIGEPEQVFQTFDYEHCKVAGVPDPLGPGYAKAEYYGDSLQAIAGNQLIYNGGSRFVIAAVARLEKFTKRGWSVHPSTPFQLANSLASLDLEDPVVVREELLGMYGLPYNNLNIIMEKITVDDKVSKEKLFKTLKEL